MTNTLNASFITTQPSVFLKQPSTWSRAIAWGMIGITTFGIGWASIAEIEKVIPAQGILEPQEDVREIQAPISGVVEDVFVKDGERIQANQPLLKFDLTATQAQLTSLEQIKHSLVQENNFYQTQIGSTTNNLPSTLTLNLPPEILLLLKNSANLVAENQFYQVQMSGTYTGSNLTPQQQIRFSVSQSELNSRVTAQQQAIAQLEQELEQTNIQLANTKNMLATAGNNLITEQSNLTTEQQILADIEPLVGEGAIPTIQYRRQKQEVGTRQVAVSTQQAEVNNQQAEVARLLKEQTRIKSAIAQAQLVNTVALTKTELQEKIALNQQKIAEIDAQLGKQIVENNKKIAEIDSQISQAKQNIKYHEIKAPVAGKIFELKAHSGFVTNNGQTVLEIVPDDGLVAEVYLTNKDRGFVKEGMEVDVRVDSFDYSEFGDVKGQLISIGANALEPDAIHSYYRFPAKIQLEQQFIKVNGREVPLASGMSVSANIKERKRKVITIFLNSLAKKFDTLEKAK
jgi:HlyD family secretion protein